MNKEIYHDICYEIARLKYNQVDLPKRLSKRVKRKFQVNIDVNKIEQLIKNVYSIYEYAQKKLPQFTMPSTTGYANPEFIRIDEFETEVTGQFPGEDRKVIIDIINWVVYWEYLR